MLDDLNNTPHSALPVQIPGSRNLEKGNTLLYHGHQTVRNFSYPIHTPSSPSHANASAHTKREPVIRVQELNEGTEDGSNEPRESLKGTLSYLIERDLSRQHDSFLRGQNFIEDRPRRERGGGPIGETRSSFDTNTRVCSVLNRGHKVGVSVDVGLVTSRQRFRQPLPAHELADPQDANSFQECSSQVSWSRLRDHSLTMPTTAPWLTSNNLTTHRRTSTSHSISTSASTPTTDHARPSDKKHSCPKWLTSMTTWLTTSEPSAQALKQQKTQAYRRLGIDPRADPKAAAAKLHAPLSKIPAGATTSTTGPSPEKALMMERERRRWPFVGGNASGEVSESGGSEGGNPATP